MEILRLCTTVVARFLISLIFLAGAVNKILHWHEMDRMLMNVLCDWQSNVGFSDSLQDCFVTLIPLTPLLLLGAIFCELIGGLFVLLGIKEKLGAGLLILFLLPTTVLMHQFWFVEGGARELQLTHFLKNLAILGGLLMILLREGEPQKMSFSP